MSNKASVYAATLMPDRLAKLADALFGQTPLVALVRCPSGAEFVPLSPGLPADWAEGQAFGNEGEIRWRRDEPGGPCVVLLLTEVEPPAGFGLEALPGPALLADPVSTPQNSALLWGKPPKRQDQNDPGKAVWWETRIPRPLHYPGHWGEKPPRLAFRLYREEKSGAVRWTRLVGLLEDK